MIGKTTGKSVEMFNEAIKQAGAKSFETIKAADAQVGDSIMLRGCVQVLTENDFETIVVNPRFNVTKRVIKGAGILVQKLIF